MSDIPSKSRFHFSPAEIGVLAFTALYMAVWLVTSFVLKNDEFVFYFIVMCVLIVADVTGDWREEVLVLNGTELHVYSNAEPNPRPDHKRLWSDRNYRRLEQTHNDYSP